MNKYKSSNNEQNKVSKMEQKKTSNLKMKNYGKNYKL